jgi:hypothetical protein
MLLGRLQNYLLNRPLRADLIGLDVFSPAESPKSMLTPFWSAKHSTRTVVVPSAQGRTVRAYAGATEDRRRRLDLAPGMDPVGEERS